MFDKLRNLIGKVELLDSDKVLFEIWKQEDTQEFIIDLNIIKQLFQKGIRADGKDLGIYQPFTVKEKKRKGQPFDRVTLRDTGDFYESFYIVPNLKGFIIEADTIKDDVDLAEKYGDIIIGLTDDSKEELVDFIVKRVADEVKFRLLHN